MLASADHAVELVTLFVARSSDTLVGVDAFEYPSVFRLDSFGVVLDLSFVAVELFLLLGGYYLLKDTQFTRKNFEVGTEKNNIAFICNDTYYSDFETTFDLSIPTNSPIGDYYSYITLGSLNNYESFETLMLTGSGIVGIKLSVTETGREYSVYYNSGNGAVWGEPKIITKLIDEAYKIKLTVKENKLTLDMDSEKILEENISSRYSGGIVAIGTPNAGVSFNDFKTVGTTNLMDSFDSYFSEDLSGSENLQQVNADEYWEVNGGMLVRLP